MEGPIPCIVQGNKMYESTYFMQWKNRAQWEGNILDEFPISRGSNILGRFVFLRGPNFEGDEKTFTQGTISASGNCPAGQFSRGTLYPVTPALPVAA